ncbi:hypothetical protein ACFQ5M_10230 [Agrilactobacillus yilanensis]|uniref:Transposase n=1 Tax=Agrilactobacillus yilanensis TaxID=2485997 RepID=A0ABW4J7X4_9LACO|nr:hypothetical protein [Agrilactobacillus yilanensis]
MVKANNTGPYKESMVDVVDHYRQWYRQLPDPVAQMVDKIFYRAFAKAASPQMAKLGCPQVRQFERFYPEQAYIYMYRTVNQLKSERMIYPQSPLKKLALEIDANDRIIYTIIVDRPFRIL